NWVSSHCAALSDVQTPGGNGAVRPHHIVIAVVGKFAMEDRRGAGEQGEGQKRPQAIEPARRPAGAFLVAIQLVWGRTRPHVVSDERVGTIHGKPANTAHPAHDGTDGRTMAVI